MSRPIEARIAEHASKTIRRIEAERDEFGGWDVWLESLGDFREHLERYSAWASPNRRQFRAKQTLLANGHVIDWHVAGYFAPFDLMRPSWGGVPRVHWQHVTMLSKALAKRGTRLVYVALPCKGVVCPEVAVPSPGIPPGKSTAPQWRKMVLDLAGAGVEVVDMLPAFFEEKARGDVPLYSFEHCISPEAAALTAECVTEYLNETTDWSGDPCVDDLERDHQRVWYEPFQTKSGFRCCSGHVASVVTRGGWPYLPFGSSSKVCIFGDCNLQMFLYRGAGIAANLAYGLGREVDYLGRVLMFSDGESELGADEFRAMSQRDVAVCISFPSGSFVRTAHLFGSAGRPGVKGLFDKTVGPTKRAMRNLMRYHGVVNGWARLDLTL